MKRNIFYFILYILPALAFTGCKKNNAVEGRAMQPSVMEYLFKDTALRLFSAALMKSQADSFLNQGGPYTLFVPDNNAMVKGGFTLEKINSMDPDELNSFVTFSMLPGRLGAAELVGFQRSFPVSLNKLRNPNLTRNYFGIFFNGNKARNSSQPLGDGVIYITDGVSNPSESSMIDAIESRSDMTIFAAIINKCWGLKKNILLDSLTVIAPDDNAFRKFGFNGPAEVQQQDTVALMRLATSFVLNTDLGMLYGSDFLGGKVLQSNIIQNPAPVGNITSVRYRIMYDGRTIAPFDPELPTGIHNDPQLIQANILTRRGVIHVVDQVFVP